MIDGIDWSAKYNIEGNRTKFDEAIQQLKEEQALLGDASGSERYKELERKIIGLSAKVAAIPVVEQPAAEPQRRDQLHPDKTHAHYTNNTPIHPADVLQLASTSTTHTAVTL